MDQSTKVHLGVNPHLILKKALVTLHRQSIESCQGDTTLHLTLLPVQFSQYRISTTSLCLRSSLSQASNSNHKVRLMTRQLLPLRHMLDPVLIILRRPKLDYKLRNWKKVTWNNHQLWVLVRWLMSSKSLSRLLLTWISRNASYQWNLCKRSHRMSKSWSSWIKCLYRPCWSMLWTSKQVCRNWIRGNGFRPLRSEQTHRNKAKRWPNLLIDCKQLYVSAVQFQIPLHLKKWSKNHWVLKRNLRFPQRNVLFSSL